MKVCSYCRKAGHLKADCRNRKKDTTQPKPQVPNQALGVRDALRCKTCNEDTHRFVDCPNNTCNNCKTKGHTVLTCPLIACKDCGQKGNPSARSKSCLKFNKDKKRPYNDGVIPESFNVFAVSADDSRCGVYIPIIICGVNLMALVDTGSTVSLLDTSIANELK